MPLRLAFMGTPDFSVPTLSALAAAGHEIACVYTQPPRPGGRRGLDLTRSPVHVEAERLGLDVRTPASLKSPEEQADFAALNADAAVVVAYGLLLPKPVLDAPRLGAWNGHASALPRWRGAAPIQRAIMAGDAETAMMVMRMEEGLDTGPVALSTWVQIDPDMTAADLHDMLSAECAALMADAMRQLEAGALSTTPQQADGVTYARKIGKDETRIDWTLPARNVHDHIRGLSPMPGAWSELVEDGRAERVKVLRTTMAAGSGEPGTLVGGGLTVACGEGAVRILDLQRAGGKPVGAEDFVRGMKRKQGARFR